MGRLQWQVSKTVVAGGHELPCADEIEVLVNPRAGWWDAPGIRVSTPKQLRIKQIAWPFLQLSHQLIGPGYVYRQLGRYIRAHVGSQDTFLDIGCGGMPLLPYVPKDCWYNAIDIAYSDFRLQKVLGSERKVNLAFASAKRIPLPADVVTVAASAEALHWIPEPDQLMREIQRVLAPGGKLICSIANGYQRKYEVQGINPGMVTRWTYDEFVTYMAGHGFKLLNRSRCGYWIPLNRPRMLSQIHLPVEPATEKDSTHFCYVFEAQAVGRALRPPRGISSGVHVESRRRGDLV